MATLTNRELAARLLPDVRNYLDITWPDPALDEKLSGIVARGIVYIDSLAGASQDYQDETLARGMLFDWCKYAMSGAANDFAKNYGAEVLMLRMQQEVASYVGDDTGV